MTYIYKCSFQGDAVLVVNVGINDHSPIPGPPDTEPMFHLDAPAKTEAESCPDLNNMRVVCQGKASSYIQTQFGDKTLIKGFDMVFVDSDEVNFRVQFQTPEHGIQYLVYECIFSDGICVEDYPVTIDFT